jgi:hypothetical protein
VGVVFVVIAVAIAASIYFLLPKAVTPGGGADPSASPSSTRTPPPNDGGVPEDENEDATEPEPDPDLADVTPFITNAVLAPDAMSITVFSFVPGLAESGGVCRASVVDGTAAEFAQGPATVEVADTVCPPLTITLAAPGSEGMHVRVEYTSESSSGVSADTVVTS